MFALLNHNPWTWFWPTCISWWNHRWLRLVLLNDGRWLILCGSHCWFLLINLSRIKVDVSSSKVLCLNVWVQIHAHVDQLVFVGFDVTFMTSLLLNDQVYVRSVHYNLRPNWLTLMLLLLSQIGWTVIRTIRRTLIWTIIRRVMHTVVCLGWSTKIIARLVSKLVIAVFQNLSKLLCYFIILSSVQIGKDLGRLKIDFVFLGLSELHCGSLINSNWQLLWLHKIEIFRLGIRWWALHILCCIGKRCWSLRCNPLLHFYSYYKI